MTQSVNDSIGGFFPPPPRPRGRGWWRRFRRAAFWVSAALGIAAIAAFFAVSFWNERQQSRGLVADGRRGECVVKSKHSTGSRSSSGDYYVTLQVQDPRQPQSFSREVSQADWIRVRVGDRIPYYYDPATGEGVAEIERAHRERPAPIIILALIALAVAGGGAWGGWSNWREMRLLRLGREVVVASSNPSVRLPANPHTFIRVGPREGELLALASDDLKRYLFPTMLDVPVERLVREELVVPLLPRPVRPASPAWRRWLRTKYLAFQMAILLLGIPELVLLVGLASGLRGRYWIAAGAFALAMAVVFLAWMRRFWRDIVLWREGDEVHAVILKWALVNRRHVYTVGFTYRGIERRAVRRLPEDLAALQAPIPDDAPALTMRAVVLVDPVRPTRWALVPESCRPN